MTDQNDTPATEETSKAKIRPNLANYVRDKSGGGKRTHRTDDFVARTLAGKSLDKIKLGANLLGIDTTKWALLNNGQQRMLIGNAIRHRLTDKKAPITEQAVIDVFGEPVAPYDAEAAGFAAETAAEEGEPAPKKSRSKKAN